MFCNLKRLRCYAPLIKFSTGLNIIIDRENWKVNVTWVGSFMFSDFSFDFVQMTELLT